MLAGERGSATPANCMIKQDLNISKVRVEQVANDKCQVIKLGLDVHAEWIVVVRIVDNSTPQPAQRFKAEELLRWIQRQVPLAASVHSCYEAGPFGFVLHRQLTELGVHNVVVQPFCLDEQRKGVNNDRTDARELALRLDRYVSGNSRALAIVRVPTEVEEQKRIASRQREQLKREVHRIGAQGRSLLLTQGYRQKGCWWQGAGWQRLEGQVPGWLAERLEVFRRLLMTVQSELEAATTALRASTTVRPKAMGGVSFQTIEREVGDWSRFTNRRQVGSYTGLCGGLSASGNKRCLLPITKHGNVRLRTALIELAWRWVLWQPQSLLAKRWQPILGNHRASAAARKKAIVAIARQLAVDLWRWRTGRVQPEQLGWIMVD